MKDDLKELETWLIKNSLRKQAQRLLENSKDRAVIRDIQAVRGYMKTCGGMMMSDWPSDLVSRIDDGESVEALFSEWAKRPQKGWWE
jgi:hypothetical protein